jgi:iduronate 2-sulfatase
MRNLRLRPIGALLLIFASCFSCLSRAAKPMNVLFIVVDDLRPQLGTYEAEGMITPHIDRFAAKGVKFNNAYCQYPVCNSSRSSFLTGLRPAETGIFSNRDALRSRWPDIVTLPQAFRQEGYFTAGLGKIVHAGLDDEGQSELFRDDASFDHFYSAREALQRSDWTGEGRKLGDGSIGWARWMAADGGDEAQPDGLIAKRAVELLELKQHQPFFIGVGFNKPHDPFIAPKEYFELYPYANVTVEDDPADRSEMAKYALPNDHLFETFSERDRREFKRAYQACTTFVDAQIGKIWATMDRLELWENTMVVVMGDHGYHLGEHGWWNKVTVFELGARVPLMIWVPGMEGSAAPTDAVVELVDLYPTLMDYAGMEAPHRLSGKTLRPVVENPQTRWGKPAFTQVKRPQIDMGYSVRAGDWRFTQWGVNAEGGHELYRAEEDRAGFYNLADHPELATVRARLQGLLETNYPELR